MSSDLDIGDIEKEEFNSEYNSESKSSSNSSDESDKKSNQNNYRDQIEERNPSKEEKEETPEKEKKEGKREKEKKEGKGEKGVNERQGGKERKDKKEGREKNDDDEEKDENGRKIKKKKSEQTKNKDSKIKELKLNKKDNKSSKTRSKKSNKKKDEKARESETISDNDRIIKKELSERSATYSDNKFFIPQYNQRIETLMNILSENSSEGDVNYKRRMKIENEIIRKEKRARTRRRFKKVDDIQFQIIGYPQTVNEIKKNEEYKLQKEKIKYLEAKNLELDRLNQMYYDLIRSTNYDIIKDNIDNYNYNNNLKLQSLDNINNNNINRIPNPLNKLSQDNLDFAIQNYIDGERNKNIHNFNDSMIDINQKITNYLIDNCQEAKEKNKNLEDFKYEIGHKLDKIEHIQKQQKHDIDFIIKYGLNKNKALDPIIGLLYDYQRPLPKLLKDLDEENKLDKVMSEKNFNSYKNFILNGRYTNNKNDNEISDEKSKKTGGILRRTGSCIFENRRNPFNKKLKENEEYKKLNSDIKNPFFDNKVNKEKNKNSNDDDYEDEEFQKFVAYKGRFFIPADFRFGGVKDKNKKYDRPKKNKNEIDFII